MSIAEKMAANQKQVAISEFFEKNKHFLGFDTLNRALITAVKEAVDNALDACEEARILPDIVVKITKLDNKKDILQLEVEDNGPGIPRASIEKVFGQLLFGSRFHAIRQSRGQQGIGITGVVMYSQLTTGDPTHVESKIAKEATAVSVDIGLDTRKNKAIKSNQDRIDWGEKGPWFEGQNQNESKVSTWPPICLAIPSNDEHRQSSCRYPVHRPRWGKASLATCYRTLAWAC